MSEPKTDATGTKRAHWTSQWRARYRRGDWLVLSGPTSLVVMQPAAPQYSELINAVWEEVVSSASIHDLAARLAGFGLDKMPDFAALFWDQGQMRSLVRGRVRLVDPSTGQPIANGDGVRTWSEVGLGDRQQVEVLAGEQTDDDALELPLVIGAAGACSVLVDRAEEVQIHSPQGTLVGDPQSLRLLEAPEPEPEPEPAPRRAPEPEPEPTVAIAAPQSAPSAPPVPAQPPAPQPQYAQAPSPQAPSPQPPADPRRTMEDGETLYGQPPVPPATGDDGAKTIFASSMPGLPVAAQAQRPVAGVLHPSSGGRIEVDRPVVIGRSPAANRVTGDQLPRLLTVPSPSHDISRTHLQVAPEGGRMVVTDLNSTNGTILVTPDGRRTDLRPGVGVPVDPGSVIDLGDGITIAVDRA